jgi:hypothetical protein
MSNPNLRNITNHFQDAHLVSLASWKRASEISPRDRNGPYVVLQEGYDPEDMRMIADEFILGRSGKWLSLGLFYKLPVAERRAEFVFGTAAEVIQMMSDLPSKVRMFACADTQEPSSPQPGSDDMMTAIHAGKNQATTISSRSSG